MHLKEIHIRLLFLIISVPGASLTNTTEYRLLRIMRSTNCVTCHYNVAHDSLCPWQYKINIDNNRRPIALQEAVCQSAVPRFVADDGLKCVVITRNISVRKRTIYGNLVWASETINVGCTVAFDCSRFSC